MTADVSSDSVSAGPRSNAHLTPIEAIMWRAGHDETLRMTVGTLLVLDRTPSADQLAERLEIAACRAPRLQRRPGHRSGAWANPPWVDDAGFDAHGHVRVLPVGAPGGRRQLLDLLALVETTPFDPGRSPWDVTVVEGLGDGTAGLYLRAHHVLTDGIGGTSLIGAFVDANGSRPRPDGSTAGRRRLDVNSVATAVKDMAAAMNENPIGTVMGNLQRALDTAGSVSRQLLVPGGSLSSLPPSRSTTSRFDTLSVPGARSAALALGGSRNDLLVAAAALALDAYQHRLGLPGSDFRVATPASRHRDGTSGGNWFAPTRVDLPRPGPSPAAYFGMVAERLARARREPAVALATQIAAAVSRLPDQFLLAALKGQAATVDFAATAFPGLRGANTVGSARIEQSYPFGPRLGRALNLTAFGHGDGLDVGVSLDRVAISEPEVFLDCLRGAFDRLHAV
jgi:WS/DGAT/MGAT family acyltransferase